MSELLGWMLAAMVIALVVALFATLVLGLATGALLWLLSAAAFDRVVGRGSSIGYWRCLADRGHRLQARAGGDEGAVAVRAEVRERIVARLEQRTGRLARRIERDRSKTGALDRWATRQDQTRLDVLSARLEHEREALWGRPAPPKPHQRVADADREHVVGALRAAHEEGRLDAAEFEERVGRCYVARTYAELARLAEDLDPGRDGSTRARTRLRLSDADREAAVTRLRAAADEGRLSEVELEERVEEALAAKTASELAPLLDDLPEPHPITRHAG